MGRGSQTSNVLYGTSQPRNKSSQKLDSVEQIFQELHGQTLSASELDLAVIEIMNQHLEDFPAGYSYHEAISWAQRHKWLILTPGKKFLIWFHQASTEARV